MSIELARRIKALEARVAALESRPKDAVMFTEKLLRMEKDFAEATGRAMCPKCGVKPNHFFHVKNCRGTQEEQKNADDKRRDPGAT
jgi:hypothetical protein